VPLSEQEIRELKTKAKQIRLDIIDTTVWSGGAHVGGALSSADILTVLYFKYLRIRPDEPSWPDRDRVVLSKGHGGVGYASVLANRGYFAKTLLTEFNHFKSPFGMHLDSNKVKGVDVSTGSLGHGLSMAVGLALGARFQKRSWLNGLMIDGKTETIMALEPFADKWRAFGWIVTEVDGHDFKQLGDAIEYAQQETRAPVVIIAKTVKGKGVDFMEGEVKWHYGSIDSTLMARAKQSVERM
jgi:transketolase